MNHFEPIILPKVELPTNSPLIALWATHRMMPVTQRPGPVLIMDLDTPKPEPSSQPFSLTPIELKFLYWSKKHMRLQRDEYIARLHREGETVNYDGATGEDRRFAQWRLAFHEAVRLMPKISRMSRTWEYTP